MREDRYRHLMREAMVDTAYVIDSLPEDLEVPPGAFVEAAPRFAMSLYEYRARRHHMRQHQQDSARMQKESGPPTADDRDRM